MNRIKLIVGDWSKDGHEKTDIYLVESNLTSTKIKETYKINAELLNFNLLDYCNKFEDSIIPAEKLDPILEILGLDKPEDWEDFEIPYNIYPEDWVKLYIAIVKYNRPDIILNLIEEDVKEIRIGGYGLYYN